MSFKCRNCNFNIFIFRNRGLFLYESAIKFDVDVPTILYTLHCLMFFVTNYRSPCDSVYVIKENLKRVYFFAG